jgi:pimeloyl-ACP methyl ester carboxylesterase
MLSGQMCTGIGTGLRAVRAPDGTALAVRDRGGTDRPAVLLLHGYPDSQAVWDPVAPLLATRLRVLSYDVRGAGASQAPRGRARYTLDTLVADLLAVLDGLGIRGPVHLVGHDWGSIQLWEAITRPELRARFASFTSIGGPGLDQAAAWLRAQWRRPRTWPAALRQLRRSWYLGLFLVPVLPELCWRSGLAGRLVQRANRLPVRPRAADGRHGLALYRANVLRPGPPRGRRTQVPVQLVVATRDPFLEPALLAEAGRWADRLTVRSIAAGHWPGYSHPRLLAGWIAGFIEEVEATPAATGAG